MRLGATESFLWYVTIGLEIILAVLVLRRRGFHRLPFFTFFVLLSALRSSLLWAVYRWVGFNSLPALYVAWSSQAILLFSRGTVCAELCWKILRKRPNLFSTMVRDLLVVIGACVVLYTAFDYVRKSFHIQSSALAIERGLALTIALVLILFSRVAFRYDVRIPRALFLVGAGLCFHSLVLAVNDTFLDSLNGSFPWWNDFRLVAFHVALSLWIWAFLTRDFDPDDKPVPPIPTFYAEHAEEVSRKLRSLERDLEEVVRK
jgi:hypothetical protein